MPCSTYRQSVVRLSERYLQTSLILITSFATNVFSILWACKHMDSVVTLAALSSNFWRILYFFAQADEQNIAVCLYAVNSFPQLTQNFFKGKNLPLSILCLSSLVRTSLYSWLILSVVGIMTFCAAEPTVWPTSPEFHTAVIALFDISQFTIINDYIDVRIIPLD